MIVQKIIQNRKLKVNHLFGNLKKNYNEYSEIFDDNSYENIKLKMESMRFNKYSNISDYNIYDKFINLDSFEDSETKINFEEFPDNNDDCIIGNESDCYKDEDLFESTKFYN